MKKYRYGVKYFEGRTNQFGGYRLWHYGRTTIVFSVAGNLIENSLLFDECWEMLQGSNRGPEGEMDYVARWKIKKLKNAG